MMYQDIYNCICKNKKNEDILSIMSNPQPNCCLTHWGRVTHICVSELNIIGSDNGLSHGRRQAIIWTNAGKLLIGHLGTNFSEILSEIHTFSFKKMHLKMSSGKCRPFCLGLNVLKVDSQKVDQHAGGKWLIHDTKRRKDNQLQSLELPCRISKLIS